MEQRGPHGQSSGAPLHNRRPARGLGVYITTCQSQGPVCCHVTQKLCLIEDFISTKGPWVVASESMSCYLSICMANLEKSDALNLLKSLHQLHMNKWYCTINSVQNNLLQCHLSARSFFWHEKWSSFRFSCKFPSPDISTLECKVQIQTASRGKCGAVNFA